MTLEAKNFYSITVGSSVEVFYVLQIDEEKEMFGKKGWVEVINVTLSSVSWRELDYICNNATLTKYTFVYQSLSDVIPESLHISAIVNHVKTLAEYVSAYQDWKNAATKKDTEITQLKERIRELEHGKFDVLEVDQWTSTGDIENYSLATFDANNINGGDADTIRRLGISYAEIITVFGDQNPSIGRVWYKEDDGKLKKYKWNYDSSD